ncbi:hypothetical protein DVH24_010713 [Malus domestica]|uniref:Uncharacterized protein n=1 Tax=Malus domestica TaxID=3750 RepID=A0A498JRI5_MALDO|nr:hypothetical protein DVH24_010713 [Malus domestica]
MDRLRRITIFSALGHGHALMVLFLGTHTRTSQWVTYHGNALARTHLTSKFRWNPKPMSPQKASCYMKECSRSKSLNFRVQIESKASESPKGLVLYGGGHVHIRHIAPFPLVDVRCYRYILHLIKWYIFK